MKYLYITRIELNKKNVFWENYQPSLMVYAYISTIEMHAMVNQKFMNQMNVVFGMINWMICTTHLLIQLKCMLW